MREIHLLDKNRSHLSTREIKKYKEEITKQKNSPCDSLSTNELALIGVEAMNKDNFCMVKEKMDV